MPGTPGKKQPSRNGSPWALGLPHTPATRLARGGRGSERRPARECAPAQLVPRVGQACAGLDPGLGAPRTRPPRHPHGSQGRAPPSAPFHGRGNRDPEAEPPPRPHSPTHGTVGREPPARLPVPRPPCTDVGRTVQLARRAEGERGDEAPQSRPLRPADLSLCLLFGQGRPMPSGGERPGLPTLSGLRRP